MVVGRLTPSSRGRGKLSAQAITNSRARCDTSEIPLATHIVEMAPTSKPKTGSSKGPNKRSGGSKTPSKSGPSFKAKKPGSKPASKPSQLKTKSSTPSVKKKPPHMRYTEKELKVPQLNGILPAGVQKRPNAKKGKVFCDDKDQMNAILAIVMAEKEGNIESRMMRARQLEEIREARRLEAEKRAEGHKDKFEERKQEIKEKKKARRNGTAAVPEDAAEEKGSKKPRKRVAFG
ncbi:60S ribosomal subunit assembly/export protein [Teratosphaeriaceae sp. CCFEE 6253]|nr:60S ribosomal subunit assembly/export protein [Teratosphaeriaceae sp. CCFEE 6253]